MCVFFPSSCISMISCLNIRSEIVFRVCVLHTDTFALQKLCISFYYYSYNYAFRRTLSQLRTSENEREREKIPVIELSLTNAHVCVCCHYLDCRVYTCNSHSSDDSSVLTHINTNTLPFTFSLQQHQFSIKCIGAFLKKFEHISLYNL